MLYVYGHFFQELEEQTLRSRVMTVCGEGGGSVKQHQMKTKLINLEETLREKKDVLNLLTSQADRLEVNRIIFHLFLRDALLLDLTTFARNTLRSTLPLRYG